MGNIEKFDLQFISLLLYLLYTILHGGSSSYRGPQTIAVNNNNDNKSVL